MCGAENLYGMGNVVLFERRRKYNVPVQMSRHPDLNTYILEVVNHVKKLLTGAMSQFAIVISDKDGEVVERFVFDVQVLIPSNTQPGAPVSTAVGAEAVARGMNAGSKRVCRTVGEIEAALRAFYLKLNVADAILAPNPPDCSFHVLVYTGDDKIVPGEGMGGNQSINASSTPTGSWIAADDPGHVAGGGPGKTLVHPLKSMDTGAMRLALYVEESPLKPGTQN